MVVLLLLGRAVRPFFQHRIRLSSRGHRPKVPELRVHWPPFSAFAGFLSGSEVPEEPDDGYRRGR
jgi:hypothetical protein